MEVILKQMMTLNGQSGDAENDEEAFFDTKDALKVLDPSRNRRQSVKSIWS
jgi:hypothetical protein